MQQLVDLTRREATSDRQGPILQLPRRRLEHDVRQQAVHVLQQLKDQGVTQSQAATLLRLTPRTLRHWHQELRQGRLQAHLLGRPSQRSPLPERRALLAVLDELGPRTGLPTLRDCFPAMPRAEVANILARYRRVWKLHHHQTQHVLHWQVPGSVWAMDFAEAPSASDALYPYLLAVRDLASGYTLLWLPVRDLTVQSVLPHLASLFALHGAPLVLKSDNGSAFRAEATRAFLQASEVIPLFSPARLPQYNGSAEAGIGSLKSRTEQQASRYDRSGQWTHDDVAFAQDQANATARPMGPKGPTPDTLWDQRPRLTTHHRQDFLETLAHCRAHTLSPSTPLPKLWSNPDRDVDDRQAVRRALERAGYLLFSRRRFTLPFPKRKTANIR
jgi:transposase InsO family protein